MVFPIYECLYEAPLVGILSEAPCFALRIGKIPMPPVGGKDWIRGRNWETQIFNSVQYLSKNENYSIIIM